MSVNSISSPLELSIIVVVLSGQDTLSRCLSALEQQRNAPNIEIIVPYDDRHPSLSQLQTRFSTVQFLKINGEHTYAELRAIGVHRAKGDIIAVTEDHCTPNSGWCRHIVATHREPYAAVGGAVEKQIPDTASNWSLYFADYVRYMNPLSAGPAKELTDCNVTYKRAALEQIAHIWQEEFHEPEVNGALQACGETLWLAPQIVVHQQRHVPFQEVLRDRYLFGRLFGGRRALTLSGSKRLVYAGMTLILPLLLTSRIAGHVIRKQRFIGQFVKSLPLLLVLNSVWAIGEGVGYLSGQPEDSLRPSSQELQIPGQG